MKYIFLDIDGVLAHHGVMNSECIDNLNHVVQQAGEVRIVFNTAWNCHSLDKMVGFLTRAGFAHPECLYSQTSGNSGGGELVRRWLRDNDVVGSEFVIIDDFTEQQFSRCRLARCITAYGLTVDVANRAIAILNRGITSPTVEKSHAVEELMLENLHVMAYSNWLTNAQRKVYVEKNCAEAVSILSTPDHEFMKLAGLSK